MAWTLEDHEVEAIKGLAKSDDRTAAIIGATVVEARLRSALEKRFQRDEKIEKEFFRSSGAMGSFSAKIDLAFLMGSLTKDAWHDLDLMKDIRNKFAHRIDVLDLKTQQIRDW
jgi:hypothetical protein